MPEGVQAFLVLNTTNVLEEKEKLVRMMYTNLIYTAMKDISKKVFSDNLSTEHKTFPHIKEVVETVNFNWYRSSWKQKTYQGNKTNHIDRQGKIMRCFKYNLAKHFAQNCTSSRNDINIVMDTDLVYPSLFNVDSHHHDK